MLKKILQLIVVLLIAAQGVMAQNVQIESVTKPPGDILIPVNMTGFSDVAAITLKISYNPDLMDFNGVDSTAIQGNWVSNAENGCIVVTYTASPTGSGYALNGKAFDLKFKYKGGFDGDLTFNESESEIAKSDLSVYSPTYQNGTISQTDAGGVVSMTDLEAGVGETVKMPVTIQAAEKSGGAPSDVNSITLVINYKDCGLDFSGVEADAIDGVTAEDNGGVLKLQWTDVKGHDFSSLTTLFNLVFVYKGGDVAVNFAPGCEIASSDLSIIAMKYENGSVKAKAGTSSIEVEKVNYKDAIIYSDPLNSSVVTIEVPVKVSDFGTADVGAITMNMCYDVTKLTYKGYTAEQLSGWKSSASEGGVEFQWSNSAGASLSDGVLLKLKFDYDTLSGDAKIGFLCGSILKDVQLVTLSVSFNDGGVTSAPPESFYNVSGYVYYNGDNNRPIGSYGSSTTNVCLKNIADSTTAYTVKANQEGYYEFSGVKAGVYFLDANTDIDGSQAFTKIDAIMIYHVPGTITGLRAKAADVNLSNTITKVDAQIVYYAVTHGFVKPGAWKADEWIFENPQITVNSDLSGQIINGICSGDANGDFNPAP